MDMTHPDILRMERHGYLGPPPEVIGRCRNCGELIYDDGHEYYEDCGDGIHLYCCEECLFDWYGIERRKG